VILTNNNEKVTTVAFTSGQTQPALVDRGYLSTETFAQWSVTLETTILTMDWVYAVLKTMEYQLDLKARTGEAMVVAMEETLRYLHRRLRISSTSLLSISDFLLVEGAIRRLGL